VADAFLVLQAALPEIQEQYQAVSKEIKALQQQEHALQEQSLNVRLSVEQLDATITKHNGKIKYWQEEVREEARFSWFKLGFILVILKSVGMIC